MSCYEICKDIIIPLIAAFIGGTLTLLGVMLTIKKENKKDRENQVSLHKPYIKITNKNNIADIVESEYLYSEDTAEEKIDFEKIKILFCYRIKDFVIVNSSNSDLILENIIIDDKQYSLGNILVLKNEVIKIITTRNEYKNAFNLIKNMYIQTSDVLNNHYYHKCELVADYDSLRSTVQYDSGEKLSLSQLTYTVKNIDLPIDVHK